MVVRFVHANTQESLLFEFEFDYGKPVVYLTEEEWQKLNGLLGSLSPAKHPIPAVTREEVARPDQPLPSEPARDLTTLLPGPALPAA